MLTNCLVVKLENKIIESLKIAIEAPSKYKTCPQSQYCTQNNIHKKHNVAQHAH